MEGEKTLEGWAPEPDAELPLARIVELAFDYRGNTTVVRRDGTELYGYVFNRDAGQGIITTADSDGAVAATPPFPAREGDEIVVSFELEAQIASTCVHLRDGQSSSSLECDL